MLTDLQLKKIDLEFDILDERGNGVLEHDDYVGLAARLLERYGVSRRSPRGQALVAAYEAVWRRHLRDWDADGDGRITRDEFRQAVSSNVLVENGFNEMHVPLIQAILAVVDSEEKDLLNPAEFADLMAVFGVSETDSRMNFRDLDVDGDDRISHEELINAFRQFYLSTDPEVPANRLFGWVSL